MASKEIVYIGNFDKSKYIFNTYSNITFEELYKNPDVSKERNTENNNEIITQGNYLYLFNNPHTINFIFPDGKIQDIFLANIRQFLFINGDIEGEYAIEVSNDGKNYKRSNDLSESFTFKYIRYVNSLIDQEEFTISNRYKTYDDELSLQDLSINYESYLEESNFVKNKENFFLKTNERKDFFTFISEHLKKNKTLALCGLEGIGKTSSILAYLKCFRLSYYYFNVKAIEKLLRENENQKIIKILLREMYHFIVFHDAENYLEKIKKILEKNYTAMDILKEIIQLITSKVETIVIDQYKTKFDEDYKILMNIINSNNKNKIIIVSSMNEDDIRKSIIISIKYALNLIAEKPKLDYYYIIKLVEVSEEDKNDLNNNQKTLLEEFGNLYIYYYKILNRKNKNPRKEFKKEIEAEINNKINEYFTNKNIQEMINIYDFIIMKDNEELNLIDCYKKIQCIPLRYFSLKIKDNNIINFSNLKKDSKILVKSSFDYIKEYFLYSYENVLINISNNNKDNTSINQESINFEKLFGYYLWVMKNRLEINNIKITDYLKVNSIFEIKDEYITTLKDKIKHLKENKSILILQYDQNAKFYDVGILEKKKYYYNLYLFQATISKDTEERLTITRLNDTVNYINGLLLTKLNIVIKNNYFFYIFDNRKPDYATINYCERNNINYLLFDISNLRLIGDLKGKPLYYYLPYFKYSEEFNKAERMIEITKLQFLDANEKNLKNTLTFLNKKRDLMKKEKKGERKKIKEINELYEYEKKLNNDKKTYRNYEREEYIINNFLLSNEFQNEKIFGISYKKFENVDLEFTDVQETNLFDLCEKERDKYKVFKISQIKIPQLNNFKPEFGCYIIFCTKENKKYYFDFINNNCIDLDNKSYNYISGKNLISFGNFYSIIFLDKRINID